MHRSISHVTETNDIACLYTIGRWEHLLTAAMHIQETTSRVWEAEPLDGSEGCYSWTCYSSHSFTKVLAKGLSACRNSLLIDMSLMLVIYCQKGLSACGNSQQSQSAAPPLVAAFFAPGPNGPEWAPAEHTHGCTCRPSTSATAADVQISKASFSGLCINKSYWLIHYAQSGPCAFRL